MSPQLVVAVAVVVVYVALLLTGLWIISRAGNCEHSLVLPALAETDALLCVDPENTKARRGAPGPGSAGGVTLERAPANGRNGTTSGPTAKGVAMVATIMRGREPQAIVHPGVGQILVGSDRDIAERVLRDLATLKWRAERRGDGKAADEWVLVGVLASRCAGRNVKPRPERHRRSEVSEAQA